MTDTKVKKKTGRPVKASGPFDEALIDSILERLEGRDAASLLGEGGLVARLKAQLAQRMLAAELTHHLAQERLEGTGNQRNGHSAKTVHTASGDLALEIPRDRLSTFDPVLVGKHQRRIEGFDDHVIGMYARGMSVREIRAHLLQIYGQEVSASLISTITDEVMSEVLEWQSRPLDSMYPVVFFDALRVKIRDEGVVKNKAVYLALGVDGTGRKEVLGLWIEQTEGAKFWLKVFNDLKSRGLEDILICVVDGLRGFPDAIEAVYPQATVQTCIVHLIRNSLNYVAWKDRKILAGELKKIYQAPTDQAALAALQAFEQTPLGVRCPPIAQMWHRQWEQVIPFFTYSPPVRRLIYTTNAIESLHMRLRKVIKNRGHFPSDEAATKLLFLALRNIEKDWSMPPRIWKEVANQLAIVFGERFTKAL